MSKKSVTTPVKESNSTWTFIENSNQLEFTVKTEYRDELKMLGIEITNNVPNATPFDLFTKHKLAEFLHNPIGPAITVLKQGHKAFFVNGKELTLEQAKKLLNDASFHKDVDLLVETA